MQVSRATSVAFLIFVSVSVVNGNEGNDNAVQLVLNQTDLSKMSG